MFASILAGMTSAPPLWLAHVQNLANPSAASRVCEIYTTDGATAGKLLESVCMKKKGLQVGLDKLGTTKEEVASAASVRMI